MDLDDINSDDSSGEVPPAPSPPQLSSTDVYRNYNRSPSLDYKSQRRRSNSRSRSPSRSRYRHSRSPDRDRDRDRGKERDRERDRDRDRDRERDRDRDRDRDRGDRNRERERDRDKDRDKGKGRDRDRGRESKKSHRKERSRSRSRSNSRSRSRSKELNRNSNQSRSKEFSKQSRKSKSTGNYSNYGNSYLPPMMQPQIVVQPNAFKNDGSFMEMFKKMQEKQPEPETMPTTSVKVLEEKPVAPPPLMVGKRRGGRILKTGMVAKPKTEQVVEQPKDAWSLYMAEVKKYREVCCQEEDNTRPLVK